MSNIHHENAWHGLDDEPGEGPGGRCLQCWLQAKREFFSKPYHRKGETLGALYVTVHNGNH